MLTKIAIIAVALFAGVHAEEDEYEPFYLRMLAANETGTPKPTTPAPKPETKAPTTAKPETKPPTTTAKPETKPPTTKPPTTETATTTAGNVATVTATIAFPMPDGMDKATFAATLMSPAAAAIRTAMAKPLDAKYCAGTAGCSVTITAITPAARRARALATAVDLDIEYKISGLSAEKAAEVATITDADMATLTTEMVTAAKADPTAMTSLAAFGITAADLDTYVVSKGVTVAVSTTAPPTTTTTTTTAADTTTAGAAEHSVFIAVAMVMFSRLLF